MHSIEDYEPFIGAEAVSRILTKALPLKDRHVVNINSTYYGGGVAAKLSSTSMLMNNLGIRTGWRTIQGNPDFFSVTKQMHNALRGGQIDLTEKARDTYESVNIDNSIRNHLDHDIIVIHDPQPLSLIEHYPRKNPWIWRCHIDLTHPNKELWTYLRRFIDQYDAAIVSIPEYKQDIRPPQFCMMPAIDPFSPTNRIMSEAEIEQKLRLNAIPTDLPIVVQVSRFDMWKDPQGVIDAWRKVRQEVDCTLVLLGSAATDDPEGEQVYISLLDQREERLIILNREDSSLVNAIQRRADVVLQKSLREGFGLTVSEAMWKGNPVIGGNVGGIRYQIDDGVNGFLVNSVDEAAERMLFLLKNKDARTKMGEAAHETVRRKFLMTRLVEQYLDLFNAFELVVRIRDIERLERVLASTMAGTKAPAVAA